MADKESTLIDQEITEAFKEIRRRARNVGTCINISNARKILAERVPQLVSEQSKNLLNTVLDQLDQKAIKILVNAQAEVNREYYQAHLPDTLGVSYDFDPGVIKFPLGLKSAVCASSTRKGLETAWMGYLKDAEDKIRKWISDVEAAFHAAFSKFVQDHNVDTNS